MKLFRTSDVHVMNYCQLMFQIVLSSILFCKLDCSDIVREWSESIEATGRRRVVLTAVNPPNAVVVRSSRMAGVDMPALRQSVSH